MLPGSCSSRSSSRRSARVRVYTEKLKSAKTIDANWPWAVKVRMAPPSGQSRTARGRHFRNVFAPVLTQYRQILTGRSKPIVRIPVLHESVKRGLFERPLASTECSGTRQSCASAAPPIPVNAIPCASAGACSGNDHEFRKMRDWLEIVGASPVVASPGFADEQMRQARGCSPCPGHRGEKHGRRPL